MSGPALESSGLRVSTKATRAKFGLISVFLLSAIVQYMARYGRIAPPSPIWVARIIVRNSFLSSMWFIGLVFDFEIRVLHPTI